MAKLNQIIAVEKGIKSRSESGMTTLYQQVQKPELFNGFHKSYQPKKEDGEVFPDEGKRVVVRAREALQNFGSIITEYLNITARKDIANTEAFSDLVVGGVTIAEKVPATYLLFLEKRLSEIRTFIGHLPVLDESEEWTFDENSELFKSNEIKTHRSQKVQRAIVCYPATEQHPAQTQLVSEDVLVGYWNNVKHSGALPAPEKRALLQRTEELLKAVKEAREAANMVDAPSDSLQIGEKIFGYITGK